MKSVEYYLDYMAQSFGVADYSNLEAQHLSLFKKYLSSSLQEWENVGDMDYLKHLNMYKTYAQLEGTITANLGSKAITLSAASDFYAVGCDIQVNDKTYIITKMTTTTTFDIFPAFMDADTVTDEFLLKYNRFPAPPYFKKVLFRRMYYFESLSSVRFLIEKDFSFVSKTHSPSDPNFFQIKHVARDDGFRGEGTISGTTVTVTSGTLTEYMAGMPFRTASLNETYYIRSITDSTHCELDRAASTDVSVAEIIKILPSGTMFFEVFPHPDESKQIVYDYLSTEVNIQGLAEIILAPQLVVESLLDVRLAKFSEDSAASKAVLAQTADKNKEAAKKKTVTDYVPSVSLFGNDEQFSPHPSVQDYGSRRGGDIRGNYRGASFRSRRG